ncbi:hypothetical protein H1230_17695 [Paenibacillus sp. 19GGS1-52]|uniref:hypothetical protein n=1 Tax=Paenibacillus sp. 19GGS1-52 TaxID=2758563 RepID=UPI001EFA4591|nr:hypothetical protein [Paenibacillus sp. 19GGS1-52]ULO04964.1 hypothetical protein H1230_17695 [Paenibacillus sp. 19GGS1-52]
MNKLPPIEKIHEAYSAIADERILISEDSAKVASSNRAKEYTVTWKDGIYTSNDSASYWQGYAGYPMIAVLMLQGKLTLNQTVASYFKGINWTTLNAKYKGKYAKAVAEILDGLIEQGIDVTAIENEVNAVYEQIKLLDIQTKRSSIKLPKSSNKE